MSRYVADASIAVKWYVPEVHCEAATRLLDSANELHVPDLIFSEFGNIVWKKIRQDEITAAKGRQIVRAFLGVPLVKHSTSLFLEPAVEIAHASGQTVYDCTYLALAVALECRMVTADRKLYNSMSGGTLGSFMLWVEDVPD